jgi:hypothetical protein
VVGGSAPYTYTITPIDLGTTLELPYFSLVEQVAEGGGKGSARVAVIRVNGGILGGISACKLLKNLYRYRFRF